MAEFDDLETSTIGIIAYWNAHNHGTESINPEDASTYGNIITVETYDNGIEGQLDRVNSQDHPGVYYRVKSDGWIIVWISSRNEFGGYNCGLNNYFGLYDFMNSWSEGDDGVGDYNDPHAPNIDPLNTCLEREVYGLYSNLDNSGAFNYNAEDVGYYSYSHPSATTITQMSEGATYGSLDGGIAYTPGVNRLYHAVVGAVFANGSYNQTIRFGGTDIAYTSDYQNYGQLDALANGLMPDPNTYYYNDLSGENGKIAHLMLWE